MKNLPLVLLLALAPLPALAASADNNIEWAGVSHYAWQDRRPLCPIGGESFQVRFQTWRDDLTAARVQVNDGAVSWITASKIGTRGPYDLWAAQVPATVATAESYWIELTDGSDTDYLSVNGLSDGTPVDGGFVLDFTTLAHAPIGATRATTGTVFKVWAPSATAAHVLGQFNNWVLPGFAMTKVGEYWIGHVTNAVPRQEYKYRFNNSLWKTDARGRAMLAPGVPEILMGTEWLEDTDWGPNSGNQIDWSKKTSYAGIVQYYRDLIALRKNHRSFDANAGWQVFHVDEGGNVIAFQRYDAQGGVYVVIANFSNADKTTYRVGLPQPGNWGEVLNSQAAGYMGNGVTNPGVLPSQPVSYDAFPQSLTLDVPQMGLAVLQWNAPVAVGAPGSPAARPLAFARVGPIPVRSALAIEYRLPSAGRARLTVYDMQGRLVRTLSDGALDAGLHTATWDGRDHHGLAAPSGMYFLQLEALGGRVVQRIPLLR